MHGLHLGLLAISTINWTFFAAFDISKIVLQIFEAFMDESGELNV